MEDKVDRLLKKSKDALCLLPFTHVNFGPGGRVALCCRAEFNIREHNVAKFPAESLWNNSFFTEVRKQMLKGERPEACRTCWSFEANKVESYRKFGLMRGSVHREWFNELADFDAETGVMRSGVQNVKVYLSNLCNLQCRMCNSEHSSRWEAAWKKSVKLREWFAKIDLQDEAYEKKLGLGPGYEQEIIRFLALNMDHLRELDFVGGEPLIQEEHYKILEMLKGRESQINLHYDTNLTHLSRGGKSALEVWDKFKGVEIYVSIDGPPELFEYIRPGLRVANLEENLRTLHREKSYGSPESNLSMFGTCAVSVYNVHYLPETAQYITSLGLPFFVNQVEFPYFLSSQVLSAKDKSAVRRRCTTFIANLENNLEKAFAAHPFWSGPERRRFQIERIRRDLTSSCNFMDAEDQSQHFEKFLEFDALLNEEFHGKSLYDFYPKWRRGGSWYARLGAYFLGKAPANPL